jgi:signal transduction histidine kinase
VTTAGEPRAPELPITAAPGTELRRPDAEALLAWVSHEVRTPLTALLGYLELVIDGLAGPLTAEQHAMLTKAAQAGARLREVADELLHR